MPLWTTTRVPEPSRWGWAFSSVGRPWVAQRVWPMPKVPCDGVGGDDGFEVAEFAGGAAELQAGFAFGAERPPATAMPAES